MKSSTTIHVLGIALTLVLGAFAILMLISGERPVGAVGLGANVLRAATTSTAFSINGIGSTRVLATTTNPLDPTNSYIRVFASICNPSATLVYLNMNQDKPITASSSVVLIGAAAGYSVCYEISDRNLYQGSVQASSTAVASVTVYVTDYVQ